MKKSNKLLIIVAVIAIPVFCLALAISGILVGFLATAATADEVVSAPVSGMSSDEVEAQVLTIAADFTTTGDLAAARQQLDTLGIPNEAQYVSFMVDRYIQENRGADDVDTQNLFALANALGVGTESMALALTTPTATHTPTPPPTATPIPPTSTPSPTATPPLPPTDTPVPAPSDTPVPPTDTPSPPTNTPGPPTDTPEPTATPEPTKPPVDYTVEYRILSIDENGGCRGTHQIFVTVLDVNGNPLDGVTVQDTFNAVPPHISGEKGPGKLEYDLWKNGFSLQVAQNPDGSPATSEVTAKLSSVDSDIPDEWLAQAGYCSSVQDCATRKPINQLCMGHYSYYVTFKKTY